MANLVTRAEIDRQARELAAQELSTGSYVGKPASAEMINRSIAHWYNKIVLAEPERFEAKADLDLTDPENIPLPEDHYGTLAVERYEGSRWVEMDRMQFHERNEYEYIGTPVGYRVVAGRVDLIPVQKTGQFRIIYVKTPPKLETDYDTLDSINGWEEWVILDVAAKMMLKEGESIHYFQELKREIEADMDNAAAAREMSNPTRIADTRRSLYNNRLYRDKNRGII